MEEDLLQTVIKVESEIQHTIESERKKAAKWLESVRVTLSRELEAKKQNLDDEYAQSLETTCRECELKAKDKFEAASQVVERLESLSDDILQDAVREFLQEILPMDKG